MAHLILLTGPRGAGKSTIARELVRRYEPSVLVSGDAFFDGMVGPWFLPRFVQAAGLHRLAYAVLMPTAQMCVHRVSTRVGHGFRDGPATEHMHAEFVRAAPDERHVITDVDDPVRTADEIIARLDAGRIYVTEAR